MWCVCVWSYRLFASLDLTASWRDCPMQSNATVELPFDRHKVGMDITFAAWCEVNIEFVEWLLCEAVDAMFVFDMSESMSKDMSERMSKDMSERVSEDMSERISEDMSERMSKDMSERMSEDIPEDMSERMSKDMSERTSEDCFQSVCEVESNRTQFRR